MAEITTATSTELQNHFGKDLNIVMEAQQIIVTRNGRKAARVIPEDAAVTYLTDSLTGILKGDINLEEEKDKELMTKYEAAS